MFKHRLPNGDVLRYNFLKDREAHKIIITGLVMIMLAIFFENRSYLDGVDDAIRSLNKKTQ